MQLLFHNKRTFYIFVGDKLSESATLPKMAVHTGNTFTIFSDSFSKVNAAAVTSSGNVSTSHTNAKLTNPAVQFASGECSLVSSYCIMNEIV